MGRRWSSSHIPKPLLPIDKERSSLQLALSVSVVWPAGARSKEICVDQLSSGGALRALLPAVVAL